MFYLHWIKKHMQALFVKLIALFLLSALAGCSGVSSGGNVDQLQNEVLSSACDDVIRNDLEIRIHNLKRTLNEKQLIKNLRDMKEDMKCT